MIKGWKCDYCSEFGEDPYEINEHVSSCSFNPANKRCFTCKHHGEEGGWSERWNVNVCLAGGETDVMWDVESGDVNCEKWEKA